MPLTGSGSRFSRLRFLLATTCLLSLFGIQPGLTQTIDSTAKNKSVVSSDFSLGAFGQLTPARTPVTVTPLSDGVERAQTTQGSSPSAGVLGTFHQNFRSWLGYNVNPWYSRFAENYSQGRAFVPSQANGFPPSSYFAEGSIGTNMYEVTVAYSVQGPRTKRFKTFAQVGGGGLFFLPTLDPSPYHEQVRAAMVFGVGLNYCLTERLGVRAEYRGLFYKNPDFAYYSGTAIPISKLFTVTNEPTVSLVYMLGSGKKNAHTK